MKSLDYSLPRARTENLVVRELPDEVLVYDLSTDKAHCLNNTAASVWKHCDGKTSSDAIVKLMEIEHQCTIDERLIWLALDELERFHLLENRPVKPEHLSSMSRRHLVRNIGFATLALPVIISITAPTAQAQASCVNPGGRARGAACGSPNQCCSDMCCAVVAGCAPGVPNNTCL